MAGRRNIFEILEQNIDMHAELEKINQLFNAQSLITDTFNYKPEQYIDNFCLGKWKYRRTYISSGEMRGVLGISNEDILSGISDTKILLYLEWISNMTRLIVNHQGDDYIIFYDKEFTFLIENVNYLIDMLGYKSYENDDRIILVEKNAAAIAVSESVDLVNAPLIMEYNHFILKGDLERKRQILKAMGDIVEPMRNELKTYNSTLESQIGYLLNNMNIRHNNKEGTKRVSYVCEISDDELEEWYDETYQLLLLGILVYQNFDRTDRVKQLISNVESEKSKK